MGFSRFFLHAAGHAVLLFCGAVAPAVAGNVCEGEMLQQHRLGSFNFETNSRVTPTAPFYRYTTCVRNFDPTNELQINWFVPGPYGWVPPGDILERHRLSLDGARRPLHSCIRYGNRGDLTQAQFFGNASDARGVEDEDRDRCRVSNNRRAEASDPVIQLARVSLPIRVFFPSDRTRPRETMLQVTGEAGINPISWGEYEAYFHFQVVRYPGSFRGDPSLVRIAPEFRGESEVIYQFFDRANSSNRRLPLGNLDDVSGAPRERRISFRVPVEGVLRLTSGNYVFLDSDGSSLAEIEVPLFSSHPRR